MIPYAKVHHLNRAPKHFSTVDEALSNAVSGLYCPPNVLAEARDRLLAGKRAGWVYGFLDVTIYPPEQP